MDLESTSMRNKIADQFPGFLPDRIESFRNSRGCRIMTFWYPTSSAKPKGKVIMIHGISGKLEKLWDGENPSEEHIHND